MYACFYRWDLQRARTLLEHQELLKKYNKKSGAAETAAEKKKEKVVTFVSKLEDGRPACISFSRHIFHRGFSLRHNTNHYSNHPHMLPSGK